MGHQNAFGFELSEADRRRTLKPRMPPYWQVTEYGRAIGYQKYPSGRTYWVARMRLRDESYRQRRLAPTEDDTETGPGMSFDAAVAAAHEWFRTSPHRHRASDTRPVGSNEHLNACPIGDVFTIGHALCELIEWKRLAAARSHFLTLVVNINHHIVPRLFSLPADQMNSERLRMFVKDVLETPPKRGNQAALPRRSIDLMSEEQLRRRKKTTNTLIGIVRVALIMAWESGRIESDRSWRCLRRLPNVDRPRTLHLSRNECFRLLDKCQPDLRNLVLGALYTGCRATELLRIQACHVGRDGAGVYITPVKSYRPRVVLLPDEGLAFFERLAAGKRQDEFLFRRQDGRAWFTNYRHQTRRQRCRLARSVLPSRTSPHLCKSTGPGRRAADCGCRTAWPPEY
jgi:integrase/recombinase XerD